jgi:hypothetical protein
MSLTGFNKKEIEETEITTGTKYLKELELKERRNFDKP